MRTHYCGQLRRADIGARVAVCGWVARRREHGEHLAFVDLRDHTGIIQCVVDGAHDIRSEQVLRITGTVRERPEGTANPNLATGEVEIGDAAVEVLAPAEPPPFPVTDDTDADEAVRLRYRYVDLRRPRMQRNLRVRAQVNSALRRAMERNGFAEVETPMLWTPTPEGAREFVVPSRLQPGSFYVLPQSPQIAKQLLMVGGFDRYFQIARCLRDEDLRADRQFEFMQLDLEASFVTQEDIFGVVSEAVLDAAEAVAGEAPPPIERLTWGEAMDRFGTDKPDLRFGMELIELSDVFEGTEFKVFRRAECIKGMRVEGQGGASRSRMDALVDRAKALGAGGLVWMRVVEAGGGLGIESPVARFLSEEERSGVLKRTGSQAGDLVLAVGDDSLTARTVMGQLRAELGRPPVGQGPYRYLWVTDFPLFEALDEEGRPVPAHHPFTMPHPDDLHLLESDPLRVRSQSYDLVLNGWELGSGSIRIHLREIQARIFDVLGISQEEAESRFGFLLGAYRYGAPPHGGFAVGLDRLTAILAGEENIREVIAFPKTQSGTDLMTEAPKPIDARVLADLGIRVLPPP